MTSAIAAIAIAALVIAGTTQTTPPEPAGPGKRVAIESYTAPPEVTRCIAYNINRKMPNLHVRNVAGDTPDESGYLILTVSEPSPATFGVIRVDRSEDGSRLTTWLPDRSLTAAPEDIARRLVAGC